MGTETYSFKCKIDFCCSVIEVSPSFRINLSSFLSICPSVRGPADVKIENADGAVATVTGLEVGTYEFTLTVTDERKLQSSDVVTVIVREGQEI